MDNIISNEMCKKCAECCKHYPFVELSPDEINELEKVTGLLCDVFTNPKGEEYFLKFKENGDCFFLKKNDGEYSCGVYEARPDICRKYPSKPKQNEVCAEIRKIFLCEKTGLN